MTLVSRELFEFEALPSDGFVGWLSERELSLVVTHSDKVITFGVVDGELVIRPRHFDSVTALTEGPGGELWLGGSFQLWRLENAVAPGRRGPSGCDRLYMPRVGVYVGRCLPVDIGVIGGMPVFASAAFSCLAVPDPRHGITPLWAPPFVTELTPDARCLLSGVAYRDDRPFAVTCGGATDEPNGWWEGRADGGVVVDVASDTIIAGGLSLPHSPRWHDGRIWLTQSGTGEVGYLDDGEFQAVGGIDGFARGLSFVDGYAIVGGSASRWDEIVEGLPVGARLGSRRPDAGIFVIDVATGHVECSLRLDGTAREINDIVPIHGARRVELERPDGHLAQELVTYFDDGRW